MRVEEVFTAAGATPRSHNIASSSSSNRVVYASGQFLVVENVPTSTSECGSVESVSECRHSKPITVLKRAKSLSSSVIFTSGGSDGRIVLWKLEDDKLKHLFTIETGQTSIVALSTIVRGQDIVVLASWGEELSGSLKAWWLVKKADEQLELVHSADMTDSLLKRSFVLAMDCHIMENGLVLLAVGNSLRKIELYAEDGKNFTRRLSVVGHTDWIHSIAFNDRHDNLLLVSAGQDTFIKLWKIDPTATAEDEGELSVTKNRFTVPSGSGELALSFNVEAVISGHEDWVHSTEWSLDGKKLVTASSDKTVIIWEELNELWTDTVRLGIIGGQSAGFFGAVFTPDARTIVASSYFGGLHCWQADCDANALWKPITMSGGHVGEVRDICWSPEGHYLATVGKDQTTRVYAPLHQTGRFIEVARPQVHGYDMQCLCTISNSCFISGAEEKILRAFRAPETFANSLCSIAGYNKDEVFTNQVLETFGARLPALGLSNKAIDDGEPQGEEDVHWEEAAFQANPVNLTSPPSEDCLQQSTLWPELHKLYGHGFEVYAVATNPQATVLATACKASHPEHAAIILWNTSNWGKKNVIPGHQLTVTQIIWSPDGRFLLSVSRDRTAILYKESSGDVNGFSYEKFWTSGKEHSRIIWSAAWLEDSRHFVTGSRDQKVILWRVDDQKATFVTSVKLPQPVTAISTSSGQLSGLIACGLQDGSLAFLSAEDNKLELKATALRQPIATDSAVSRLRFHPKEGRDGCSLLAYSGTDGLTRILKVSL